MKFLKYLFISLFLIGLVGCNDSGTKKKIQTVNNKSRPFITKWKTDNYSETSANNQITIPTIGKGYNYSVDWGDGKKDSNVTGDITHTYSKIGEYTVKILGDFPQIYFKKRNADKYKIVAIEQWGDIKWRSMKGAFAGCGLLQGKGAVDNPDLSQVKDMSQMFYFSSFNQDIGSWDVSNITNMSEMFATMDMEATFNQDIGSWDVSNVINMNNMFRDLISFNQDLSDWNVSNVKYMNGIFLTNESTSTIISSINYSKTLKKWSKLKLQKNVKLMTTNLTKYSSDAKKSRDFIIANFGWNILDGGIDKTPTLSLNGDSNITVYLNHQYKELNATALDTEDGDISSKITIKGSVNTSLVGKNLIIYSVMDSIGNKVSIERMVNVVKDLDAPILELRGDVNITIYQNQNYTELGAIANDNADGDISSYITISGDINTSALGERTIVYTIHDNVGNEATLTRRVTVIEDVDAPIIKLNGASRVDIYENTKYIELNATAMDNADGDISSSITISGSVDSSVLGETILIYSVTDSSGNKSSVERVVNIIKDIPIIKLNGNSKVKVYKDEKYMELNATAYDNADGDISSNITIEGTVDGSVVGETIITYSVEDSAGNEATAQRVVTVYIDSDKDGVSDTEEQTKGTDPYVAPPFKVNYSGILHAGNTIVLEANLSNELKDKNLTYNWSLTEKPDESKAFLGEENSTTPYMKFDKKGLYTVSLNLKDGETDLNEFRIDLEVHEFKILSKISTDNGDNHTTGSVDINEYEKVEIYNYDKNGILNSVNISYSRYGYEGSNSGYSATTKYFYNYFNQIVKELYVEKSYFHSDKSKVKKSLYLYNQKNLLITKIVESNSSENDLVLINSKKIINFKYDANNNLVEEMTKTLVTKITSAHTTFDEFDSEYGEVFVEEEIEELPITISKAIYTYDNYHNRLTEKYDMDNDGTYDKEITNEYVNGLIVKRVEGNHISTYSYDLQHRLYNTSTNYSYDKDDNLIKTVNKSADSLVEYAWKEF